MLPARIHRTQPLKPQSRDVETRGTRSSDPGETIPRWKPLWRPEKARTAARVQDALSSSRPKSGHRSATHVWREVQDPDYSKKDACKSQRHSSSLPINSISLSSKV